MSSAYPVAQGSEMVLETGETWTDSFSMP